MCEEITKVVGRRRLLCVVGRVRPWPRSRKVLDAVCAAAGVD